MATILSFRPSDPHRGSPRPSQAHPAEIVFFPGVRYERLSEAPKPAKRRRTRRDKIELQD